MIVVDTNTVAYLYLPTKFSNTIEELLQKDSDWAAPWLWRSEMRNILSLYLRKKIIDLETACSIQNQAELLLAGNEYEINSTSVITIAETSGCSAYDREFISLAKSLNTKLITADKKLLKQFPNIAMRAADYIA